ncbi:hypothetical protein [Sphingomonas sp. QA11]|nr:hypothetical protein [Sphingomonas sp. QA11]
MKKVVDARQEKACSCYVHASLKDEPNVRTIEKRRWREKAGP